MPKIYDIITAKAIGNFWEASALYREPYFGESKFPNRKKLGLELSWIKGAKNAPVMLMPSALDAKVVPISRQGFEMPTAKIPFFKNSRQLNEDLRQRFNSLAEYNSEMAETIAEMIFNDEVDLLENAALTREVLRMQALTTGAISIASNRQVISYDYGVPAENKKTPTIKWDVAASADPIADINAWILDLESKKGVKISEMLINSVTLSYIQKAAAVKNLMFANVTNQPAAASRTRTIEFLKEETGLDVYVYDKGYDNNGTFTKFVADGTVVLMPANSLGNTWFGTTPEESDLMNGVGTKASVKVVDTGVAVATYKEEDPVTVITKVSELVLPSFEMADCVIIASVKTGG